MSRGFDRSVWRTTGTVELRGHKAEDGISWRRAMVYPVNGDPASGTWRLRIESYPDHHEPGPWWGGQVMWHCDSPDRDAVEAQAQRWVADGVTPTSI